MELEKNLDDMIAFKDRAFTVKMEIMMSQSGS